VQSAVVDNATLLRVVASTVAATADADLDESRSTLQVGRFLACILCVD
jgi:hypothetical protein